MNIRKPGSYTSLPADSATGTSRNPSLKARGAGAIRILVVMRQRIFRAGLAALLERDSDFEIVGKTGDCAECCRCVSSLAPDVLLCGLENGWAGGGDSAAMQANGPKALGELCQTSPATSVIVLHDNSDEWTMRKTVRIGVRGYLTTNTSPDNLFLAIREVNADGNFIEPALQSRLLDLFRNPDQRSRMENQTLTKREWEVLSLLAQGKRNKEIAEELFMSQSAVKHHVSTLLRKFKSSNRTEAVRTAIARGLIDPPS